MAYIRYYFVIAKEEQMDCFQKIDGILHQLGAKNYGQVTDEKIDEALQDMKQVVVDAPEEISNMNNHVSQFLADVKKIRWDKVAMYAPQTKQKIEEMKKWYLQKMSMKPNTKDNEFDDFKELMVQSRSSYQDKVGHEDQKELADHGTNTSHFMSVEQRSKEASDRLLRGNPNIADLTDNNRPTKLAERYSELYDNEWTDAFLYITQSLGKGDTTAISILLDIVLTAYKFCEKEADADILFIGDVFDELLTKGRRNVDIIQLRNKATEKHSDRSHLRQYRKKMADKAVDRLMKEFEPELYNTLQRHQQNLETSRTTPIHKYANKCVELCWCMCVQDPQVHMCTPQVKKSQVMTPSLYRFFTKLGTDIDFHVWPAVLLYRDGPVLCKGIVQCK